MGTEFIRGPGPKLYVGPWSGYKQECICVEQGVEMRLVGFVRNPQDRDHLIACLKHLMEPMLVDMRDCDPKVPDE